MLTWCKERVVVAELPELIFVPELQAEQWGRAKQYFFNEYSLSQEYFKHSFSITFP